MPTFGNYVLNTQPENEFASRSDDPNDKLLDSLTPEQARALANRAMASEEEKAAADTFHKEDLPAFFKLFPSYKDTPHNMKLMKLYWESTLGVSIPSLEDMEASFLALRESGVLHLDAAQVKKEDLAAAAVRADEHIVRRKEREFSIEHAETMDLETLRTRCNEELKKGGW
jgi:hypothetical protein